MTRMASRRSFVSLACVACLLASHAVSRAQPVAAASTPAPQIASRLYAVEFKVGPRWVASKPAHEQEHFREHSANLGKLREQGSLVLGARYGDKGLVVLSAESQAAARAMVEQDVSVKNGTFSYELHEFSVFYGGAVQPVARRR